VWYYFAIVRRLGRILVNGPTLLSLCAVVAWHIWTARSPHEPLIGRKGARVWWVTSERSSVSLSIVFELPIPEYYVKEGAPQVRPMLNTLDERDLRFFACTSGRAMVAPGGVRADEWMWKILKDFPYWRITIPSWSATLVLMLLPVGRVLGIGMKMARAKRRRGLGLCFACGYDLRATPERCPECGTVRS
jgi:hypothetical protein